MDLDAVRTFAAVVDAGQFSEAADALSVTQQAVSRRIATLEKDLGAGGHTHLAWPDRWDLRRIAIRDPVPVYPHSLVWDTGNAHPALPALRGYLTSTPPTTHPDTTWTPTWAQRPARLSQPGGNSGTSWHSPPGARATARKPR